MTAKQFFVELPDGEQQFTVSKENGTFHIQHPEKSQKHELQLIGRQDGMLYLKCDNRCIRIGMVEHDDGNREWTLKGNTYETQTINELQKRAQEKAKQRHGGSDLHQITSTIPGQIGSIHVKEGDQVQKEEVVLTLAAMKLENEVKSLIEGTVKTIHVEEGDNVDKNALLMEITHKDAE